MTVTVVYSDASDKHIYYYSSSSSQQTMDGVGSSTTSADSIYVYAGALKSGSSYYYLEAFFRFDTSVIGGDVVSDVIFSDQVFSDNSPIDVGLDVRSLTWDGSSGTGNWQTTADLAALPKVASVNTSVYVNASVYVDFISTSAFPAEINGSGYTSIVVHYDGHATNTPATGSSYWSLRSAENSGTTTDPKLTITHAPGITPAAILLVI